MHPLNDLQVHEGSIALQWFGQSSYGLKDAKGTIAMIDPYFPRERSLERYIQPVAPVDEGAVRTDYVLLTHHHRDHTCLESLERTHAAWPKAQYIGPEESIEAVRGLGVPASLTQTIAAGEHLVVRGHTIHAVWAKPPEGDPEAGIDVPDVTHLGYVVEVDGVKVYISGDPIHTFPRLDALVGPVKSLQPDIGLLTTHPDEGEFPFFAGSAEMAVKIGLKAAVPAHYGCFVKRNYDPREWADLFPADGPETIIIPYNGVIQYAP